ncbi:MAG: DUF5011 domain-containing protein [Sulfurovum sp.]
MKTLFRWLLMGVLVFGFVGCGGGGDSATEDTTKPIITLNGDSTIELVQGTAYFEQNATVTDNIDSNLVVTISGSVDINTIGSYTITYRAKDSAGNQATLIRTINIINLPIGGVVTKPASLVALSSASSDRLSAEWLPANGTDFIYEVHISKVKNFTPDSNTLKIKTSKEYATINGLEASTEYFVSVVTATSSNRYSSSQLFATTSDTLAKIQTGLTFKEITTTDTLKLGENNITLIQKVEPDDIIFSEDSENHYLRRVISTTSDSQGHTVAQTENINIRDVYENLSFSSSVKMIEIEEDTTTTNSKTSTYQRLAKIVPSSNTKLSYNTTRKWTSGLTMSSTRLINSTQNRLDKLAQYSTPNYKIVYDGDTEEQEEDYFSGSIASNKITVELGDSLNYPINITSLGKTKNYEFDGSLNDSVEEREKKRTICKSNGGTFWYDEDGSDGILNLGYDSECNNIPVKVCEIDVSISSISVPSSVKNSGNQPYMSVENSIAYLKWSPNKNNIDYDAGEPYNADIDVVLTPGILCGTVYETTLWKDTIDLNNISIQAGDTLLNDPIRLSQAEKTILFESDGLSISNLFTADFSPNIYFDGKFSATKGLEKAKASLKSTLRLGDKFVIKANGTKSHTFNPKPIYTKKFTKIIQAGYVPIVIVGRLRLMVVADIEAEGEIEVTIDINSALTMDIEINYNPNTEKWKVTKNKSFTYEINAGGKGEAKVTGTVRIIPSLELSLYEAVASHFVLEPYIYATVGLKGEINANITKDIATTVDSSIQFSALEAGVGLDAKVYVGLAWDSKLTNSLSWPEEAVFAGTKLPLRDASFMNPKHIKFVKEYYDETNKYNKYELLPKAKVVGIPDLDYTFDYSAIPPSDISNRAVKISANCTSIDSFFYTTFKLGKKNYIKCGKWSHEYVSDNYKIDKAESQDGTTEFWLTPLATDGIYGRNILRLVNNSSLGWARQYIRIENPSLGAEGEIPEYWSNRYDITNPQLDADNDGYSNLLEYQNGTNPNDSRDIPSVDKDISIGQTNTPPTANAGEDQTTITLGASITLSATQSTDNETPKSELIYEWSGDNISTSNDENYTIANLPLGEYSVTLKVTDTNSMISEDNITITVILDNRRPTIAIIGESEITLNYGEEYRERGALVSDNNDGLSSATISGEVDSNQEGIYTITYTATDSSGNEAIPVTRIVFVLENITLGTVFGHIYNDSNTDGIQEAGEPNLSAISVIVTDTNGTKYFVLTDMDGNYVVNNLNVGIAIVEVNITDNIIQTEGTNPTSIMIVEGINTFEENNGFTIEQEIEPQLPIAHAGDDKTITYQDDEYLSAKDSNDSDGFIVSYKWYENGLLLGEEENLSLAVLEVGTHLITLLVIDDDDDNGTDEIVVTVNRINIDTTNYNLIVELININIDKNDISQVIDLYLANSNNMPVANTVIIAKSINTKDGTLSSYSQITNDYGHVAFNYIPPKIDENNLRADFNITFAVDVGIVDIEKSVTVSFIKVGQFTIDTTNYILVAESDNITVTKDITEKVLDLYLKNSSTNNHIANTVILAKFFHPKYGSLSGYAQTTNSNGHVKFNYIPPLIDENNLEDDFNIIFSVDGGTVSITENVTVNFLKI